MMQLAILGCLIFIPHFILLGSTVSAVSVGFIALRVWAAKNYPSPLVMYLFLLMSLAQGILMVDHWEQSLSILATSLATFIYFKLRGVAMRLAFVASCLLWVGDSIITDSWSNGILNTIGIIIHLHTAYRIHKDKSAASTNNQ